MKVSFENLEKSEVVFVSGKWYKCPEAENYILYCIEKDLFIEFNTGRNIAVIIKPHPNHVEICGPKSIKFEF